MRTRVRAVRSLISALWHPPVEQIKRAQAVSTQLDDLFSLKPLRCVCPSSMATTYIFLSSPASSPQLPPSDKRLDAACVRARALLVVMWKECDVVEVRDDGGQDTEGGWGRRRLQWRTDGNEIPESIINWIKCVIKQSKSLNRLIIECICCLFYCLLDQTSRLDLQFVTVC